MNEKAPPIKNVRAASWQALQQAIRVHQQGRFDQAERSYEAILKAQPNHFDAKHLLGVLRYQQGRNTEAFDYISAALKLKPDSVAALSSLGLVLRKLGRPNEALASYDKALAIEPELCRGAQQSRQRAAATSSAPRRRWRALTRRWRSSPTMPRRSTIAATRCVTSSAPRRRWRATTRRWRSSPDYAEALNNRGNALRDLERLEEALASYDKALAIKPDYAEGAQQSRRRASRPQAARGGAGELRQGAGDQARSRTCIQWRCRLREQIVRLDPAEGRGWSGMGSCRQRQDAGVALCCNRLFERSGAASTMRREFRQEQIRQCPISVMAWRGMAKRQDQDRLFVG